MSETKATLYLSHNCKSCLEVLGFLQGTETPGLTLSWVHPAIDSNSLRREHILIATGERINTIPAIPALTHQGKLIVGMEDVIAYLKLNSGKL
jgi:hypothetical protein